MTVGELGRIGFEVEGPNDPALALPTLTSRLLLLSRPDFNALLLITHLGGICSLGASWMFVLAIIVGLPKTLAALPISPTTSITIGDKLFDNFVFALVGDGGLCCRPPFGASEISVTPLTDGQGNVGVRFEGPFAKAAFADDGEPWGFFISFDVATLDGGQRIDGSRLSFDAVVGEGGFGEVISGISTSSGEFVTTLSVIAADTFTLSTSCSSPGSIPKPPPISVPELTRERTASRTSSVDSARRGC